MPRRPLLLLTLLVLLLHGWVLSGLPLAWKGAHAPAGTVFSTRSIAPPPPAPPAVQASAPAVPPPAPRPKPRPRPQPVAQPPANPMPEAPAVAAAPTEEAMVPADSAPPMAEVSPEPETAPEPPAPMAGASETTEPQAPATAAPPVPDASTPAPVPTPAQAPSPASAEDPGVDIVPPGNGTGHPTSSAPPPVKLPPPTKLSFDVSGQAKRFHYSARASLLWTHDGNRYEARQEISAFLVGTRSQTSTGQIGDRGLQPTRFGDRARSEQAAHFDFGAGRVTFSANTPSAAIAPGAQDRLSVFIQLASMLAADPARYPVGTEITLTTVSARASDRWTFRVEGEETLELPAGTLPAWKLQRLPRRDYDQKAELWLAPSLQYLPVRIRLTQSNGDFADLSLTGSTPP